MGVAGTNTYPRCSHCGQRRDDTEDLRCPHCGRRGRHLLNGYCVECVERRAGSGAHLKGARKCVVRDCSNYTDEGRFIGDVCAPCWSFMLTGRANPSQACRNVLREVSKTLGARARESVEELVAGAVFAAVSAAEPGGGEQPGEVLSLAEPRTAGELDEALSTRVFDLELSIRSQNCLDRGGGGVLPIKTVGELVQVTESELFLIPGMGRRAVREVKDVLASMGLSLAAGPAAPK